MMHLTPLTAYGQSDDILKKEWTVPPCWYVPQRGLYFNVDTDCVLETIPGCAPAQQKNVAQASSGACAQQDVTNAELNTDPTEISGLN